jgi:hypothetical protein
MDLVLRYMDIKGVAGKRWFFRPLAAYYSGHIGKISKEIKQALNVSKKEVKKVKGEQKAVVQTTVTKEPTTVKRKITVLKKRPEA